MNLYRFLSYLVIVAIIVLIAALAAMVAALTGAAAQTPDVRKGLTVLVIVLILAILILLFLLCLARAKERLQNEKKLYRLAHGTDMEARARAEKELEERSRRRRSICDILVRRKFQRPCLQLPIKITRRPDPCIYSQFYLMAAGQPVTWDNPNVEILLGGVPQDTFNLQPATNYQVKVGIENASPFFDAINTQVQVNLLSFGIGAPSSSPLFSFVKNIPAATAFPGIPETFNWTSPTPPPGEVGHYCIQVLISHSDDLNPGNNEGWNNTEVRSVQPGETFQRAIPVWNARRLPPRGKRRFGWLHNLSDVELRVDSYILDHQALATGDLDALFGPRAARWGAAVTPAKLVIPPGSERGEQVEFRLDVPADVPAGTQATFNVTATAGGWPLGGVTFHLKVQ